MIYFASDIHLQGEYSPSARGREEQFLDWLEKIEPTCEALFLLGDVFDYFFEYRFVVPKGFVRTLGKLAHMTDKGIRVVMFTGNHDMWLEDYLHKECGIEIHTEPQLMQLCGKDIYLSHGDNTNIAGKPALMLLNWVFRSKGLKFLFHWLIHPDLATWLAHKWSDSSRKNHLKNHSEDSIRFLEPLQEFAGAYAVTHHVDYFLFGHMHIPFSQDAPHAIRFLGSWYLRPSYAQLDQSGNLTLKFL